MEVIVSLALAEIRKGRVRKREGKQPERLIPCTEIEEADVHCNSTRRQGKRISLMVWWESALLFKMWDMVRLAATHTGRF